MGKNVFEKIISEHVMEGKMEAGQEITLKMDQTLTQDSLGAMAYLQYEAIRDNGVETELSVSYVDHLMMQSGEGNADVHRYLETIADQIGVIYSKPGNGICHQLHLERHSAPGKTLIGSDSHTVTCGAVGMAAFGAGGLDVALAMAGRGFHIKYPRVIRVVLSGGLKPWCTAKDVVLELLKELRCKGNTDTVLEYAGEGLKTLTIPQRATIANMGAEAGVTTSIFPSDDMTLSFLKSQQREQDFKRIEADADAVYEREIHIDMGKVEPNVALPHSPDNVKKVSEVKNLKVDQVLIGSCTNSSFQDMMRTALILKGKKVAPELDLGIAAGSRQVMTMLAASGALGWMIEAGARILENACGFCVGHGQAPQLGGISVRTNNRNYKGRSGTQDAGVYLVSPETAAATAIAGYLTDPRSLGMEYPDIRLPEKIEVDDSMFLSPGGRREIYRSRIIGEPPVNTPAPETIRGRAAIKVGDAINTDDIIPAGPAMVYRANIKKSCEFIFQFIDDKFPAHCREIVDRGFAPVIVAGESYGQGSSREHAALCPMAMGVRFILAKSIERIHRANLVNFGIIPLTFAEPEDYDDIHFDDELIIEDVEAALEKETVRVFNRSTGKTYVTRNSVSAREKEIILAGGALNYARK